MGNYATREEREPEVSRWVKACEGERLTRKEGTCIVEAAGEDEIAACPRALVPELVGDPKGCAEVGEKAAELLEGAEGQIRPIVNVIDEVPEVVKTMCVEGRWKGEAKRCLMEAQSYGEAERCIAMLDGGQRRAIERRFTAMVKRGMVMGKVPPRESGMPGACKQFVKLMRAYGNCQQMPPAAKTSIEQAIAQMETTWKEAKGDARKQALEACTQGMSAMTDAMRQIGCAPPPQDPWE